MAEEFFDIVDENNQLTGKVKSREEVHKNMVDWHRTSGIWLINPQNKILCQNRSINKDSNAGMWQSFVGGHLKAGETYNENAIIEVKEELGLDIKVSDLVIICTRKSEKMKHFSRIYVLGTDKSADEFKFNDGEVDEVKWFSIDLLQKEMEKGKFCNDLYPEILDYIKVNS